MTHIPPGSQVTVAIGRNVGGNAELSLTEWFEFREMVGQLLRDTVGPTYTAQYDGYAEWEGTVEESTTFIASGTTYPANIEHVDTGLAAIARAFGQTAIAWSYGPALMAVPAGTHAPQTVVTA